MRSGGILKIWRSRFRADRQRLKSLLSLADTAKSLHLLLVLQP